MSRFFFSFAVCLSLGRYFESHYAGESSRHVNNTQASVYLEGSEYFWEAAHEDKAHGCTDPPEILRLHARDAQAKALSWFEKAGNRWMQSEVLLKGALHLRELEEYDEAGYFAEQSSLIEKELGNAYDGYVAYGVAAHCYALNKNYVELERVLQCMSGLAKDSMVEDKFEGFTFAPAKVGWQTSWTEMAMFNVAIASFLFNVVLGRNAKMGVILENKLKAMIMVKDGRLGELWECLNVILKTKRAEKEANEEEISKCRYIVLECVRDEEVVNELMEQVESQLTRKPNYDWTVEK